MSAKQISQEEFHYKYIVLMKWCCNKFTDDEEFVAQTNKILATLVHCPPNSNEAYCEVYGNCSRKPINFYTMMFNYCVKHRDNNGFMDNIDFIENYIKSEWKGFKEAVMAYQK